MKLKKLRQSISRLRKIPLLVSLFFFLLFPFAVFANDTLDFNALKERRIAGTPLLTQAQHQKLSTIQKYIEQEKYQQAKEDIEKILSDTSKLGVFEQAQLHNLAAYLAYQEQNYAQALISYQAILPFTEVTEALFHDTLYALAQLYYLNDELVMAASLLDVWLYRNPKAGAFAYELQAQIFYRQQKFDEGIVAIEKAIALYRQQQRLPMENWYRLLMAMHYELKNNAAVLQVLRYLVMEYSKREYWVQLSAMYGLLNQTDALQEQMSVLDLAHVQNYLENENEYINLAYLYLSASAPYKAAKVVEAGLQQEIISDTAAHRSLLANAWSLAREMDRAVFEMEKAASLSEQGDVYFRLGQIYLGSDAYQKARDAFVQALQKSDLHQREQAKLFLAISHVKLQEWPEAEKVFASIQEDEVDKEVLRQWKMYMQNEKLLSKQHSS